MNISELSVKRPITVIMVTLMVAALGVISITKMPLLFFPEIDFPSLRVQVDYPSSSPEEVDQDITRPLEDILGTVSELKTLSSTSSGSGANISMEFDMSVDMDLKALEVRDKIDQVRGQLPADVRQIRIRRWQTSQSPVMYFTMAMKTDKASLYEIAQNVIVPRFERLDGVANVDIRGLDQKSIFIDVNPSLLHSYSLDMYNLAQSIRANNVDVTTGYGMSNGKKYFLRVTGEYRSLDDIRNQPIRGTNLRIRDVANVRYDFPERNSVYHFNGHDAVSFRIYKASTANVVATCQAVKAELQKMAASPEFNGLEYRIFRDSSEEILGTLNNLAEGGIYGGILAVILIFLFLWKLRSTFVMALSIPVSVVTTFTGMYLLRILGIVDITINIISLSALVFAVGMIVDCSIVVLENIYRLKQDEGLGAMEAAIKGSRQVGMAVFASTLTTIIVFVPFIFASNSMFGRFMRDFGIVVTLALGSSLLVSLTLVPMVSSRIYTGKERPKLKMIQALSDRYGQFMELTLRWRYLVAVLLIPIIVGSVWLFQNIEREDMPHVNARQLTIQVLMPSNYTLDEMKSLFDRIEKVVIKNKPKLDMQSFSTDYGRSSRNVGRYVGELELYLIEEGQTLTPVETVRDRLLPMLRAEAGVEYKANQMQGFGHHGNSGLNVQLRGDNQDVLNLYAQRIKERLSQIPGLEDVTTDMESGDSELHLSVNRERAEKLGLTSRQVAQTISSALSERPTTQYKTDNGEVDVIVRFPDSKRKSMQEILDTKIATSSGTLVPLYSVVDTTFKAGPKVIRKENRKRIVTISGNTDRAGMMWLNSAVSQALADLHLPKGYSWDMGRSFRRFQEDQQVQSFSILLALIFIYLVMASLFESLVHPITILFTVPFAISGISIMFWLTNTQLSSMAYLGIILLCGLVVNNAIILVDHINTLRREGMPRREAIIKGGKDRIRPILMTALSTMFGMIPMILPIFFPDLFGVVSYRARQWSPIALALFGGLTTSTFLTLIVLPTLYSITDDIRDWAVGITSAAIRRVRPKPKQAPLQSH